MSNYHIAIDRDGNYDLAHYGIPGMRWGVRRDTRYSGSSSHGQKRSKRTYTRKQKKAMRDSVKLAKKTGKSVLIAAGNIALKTALTSLGMASLTSAVAVAAIPIGITAVRGITDIIKELR